MQTVEVTKDIVIRFRAEQKDRDRLEALSVHYEMSEAQVVRLLIKEKALALGIEPAPLPPPSRPRAKKK